MVRELPDGTKYEYRHNPAGYGCAQIECRELRKDGHAYDDRWHPCDADEWVILQRHSPEILRSLIPALHDSSTLTPRG